MKHIMFISACVTLLLTCNAHAAVESPITAQEWANYLARSAKVLGGGLSVGFTARCFIQFTAFQLRALRLLARR